MLTSLTLPLIWMPAVPLMASTSPLMVPPVALTVTLMVLALSGSLTWIKSSAVPTPVLIGSALPTSVNLLLSAAGVLANLLMRVLLVTGWSVPVWLLPLLLATSATLLLVPLLL